MIVALILPCENVRYMRLCNHLPHRHGGADTSNWDWLGLNEGTTVTKARENRWATYIVRAICKLQNPWPKENCCCPPAAV